MTAVHETGKFMINGIINVYKEKGYTSFDVVAKLRGILKTKKIGHTGTLDPDAEGVLPVCLGKATKVCDLLTDKNKEYVAVMLLGKVTDTQDTTGTRGTSGRSNGRAGKRGSPFFYRGIHAGSADVFCIKSERKETVRSRKGRCDGGTSGKTGSDLFH